jgi:hypothetical protein
MRRRPSKGSTVLCRFCPSPRVGRSATASSTIRHGTLSLYAALDTSTGKVRGKTVAHHTSEEFVAFLSSLVAAQPAAKEIHIIADNLSAHKTKRVTQFLADHPNVVIRRSLMSRILRFVLAAQSWVSEAPASNYRLTAPM